MFKDVLDILLTVTEIIGTVAFSISGALVAIHCGLDMLGVVVLGCITAVGGGMMRDVLIGNTPPLIFANSGIFLLALITAIVVFVLAYINARKFEVLKERTSQIINLADAIGLAAFSVSGIEVAVSAGYGASAGVTVAMGVITGVGGGVLRDVLAGSVPSILKKHIYALVSVVGCVAYYLIRTYTPYDVSGTILVATMMVLARVLAMRYRWSLPKIRSAENMDKKH